MRIHPLTSTPAVLTTMPLRITRTVSHGQTNDAAKKATLPGADGSTTPSPKKIALAPPTQVVHNVLAATFL